MSRPLQDGFPTAVIVGGAEYEVDSDFRTALDIMAAFEDPGLTPADQVEITLELLYGGHIPADREAAFEMAVRFLDCGERRRATAEGERLGRLYSFVQDGRYIYSAIQMTHGIDLAEVEQMHWWRFCYLLQDLREDCYFQRMLYLRARRAMGRLTREEQEEWRRSADILTLPEYRDPEAEAASAAFDAGYQAARERRSHGEKRHPDQNHL